MKLRDRLAAGAYRHVTSEPGFADAVSADAVAASGDQHLRLRHSVTPLRLATGAVVPESGRQPEEARLAGHGFAKVERLAGNIALLDIRRFFPPSMSRAAAVGAMHLVAGADCLIVDLRRSAGGEPEMVALLCSYLFVERTHLNDLHFPGAAETIEYWTDPAVPGPRFGGDKPVWVLTSRKTISAAEEFAYDLQQLGRAIIVGETTAGAANFDFRYRVSDHLMFSVPSGQPVNPVSGRGWEGVGIVPDVPVPAPEAFATAHRLALEHVLTLGAAGHRRIVAAEAAAGLAARRAAG